ncbi:MAG: chemotaxis protein CheX [Magnetococcales bacterium]|nr:chemotaxis protein CheX [Magnetococcales bacterium]NGZ29281.1 chemotaxis protein CheX [Magnetococcales bacterium]
MSNDSRVKLLDGLRNTVIEVMGTMAWSSVQFAGMEETDDFILKDEVAGLIQLFGHHQGMVGISCKETLGRELVGRMVGLAVEDLTPEDLRDGVAELANMICGGMKTKAQISELNLSPPVAIIGRDYIAQWKTDHATMVLTFLIEEEVFLVHACI